MEKLESRPNLFRFPDMTKELSLKKVSISNPQFIISSEYGLQNALQKVNIFSNLFQLCSEKRTETDWKMYEARIGAGITARR